MGVLAHDVARACNAVTVIRQQQTMAENQERAEEVERLAEQARTENLEQEIETDRDDR
jgi:hypothetical protein